MDEKEFFDDSNKAESNWFKFEKVGDRIFGELVEQFHKEGEGDYPDQEVYVLKTKEGELINVGISVNKTYVTDRAKNAKFGDILGFYFKKEVPASKKGMQPAKSIEVYIKRAEPKSELETAQEDKDF